MGFKARLSPNKFLLGAKEEAHSYWLGKVKAEKLGNMGIWANISYTTFQLYVATSEDRFRTLVLPLIKLTPQIVQDYSIVLPFGFPETVQQVDFAR